MDNYSAFTNAFYHENLKFLHDYFTSESYLLIALEYDLSLCYQGIIQEFNLGVGSHISITIRQIF